jgi:hypothetical protein
MSDPPPATSRRQAAGAKPKKAASPPKKPPPSKMPPEKRLSRTRKSCPQNLHARIQRSVQQRMYLVQRPELPAGWEDKPDQPVCEFVVLGSTGNAYKVQLDRVPRCTCPDFVRKEDLCKHVFFVLLKCVGIDPQSHLLYQKAFLTSEIRDLLRQMQGRRTGGAGGGDAVEVSFLHCACVVLRVVAHLSSRSHLGDHPLCALLYNNTGNSRRTSSLCTGNGSCGGSSRENCGRAAPR